MFGTNDNTQSTQTTDTNATLNQVTNDMMQASNTTPPLMDPMANTGMPTDNTQAQAPMYPPLPMDAQQPMPAATPQITTSSGDYLGGADASAPTVTDPSMTTTPSAPDLSTQPSADNPEINDLVLNGAPAQPETTVASIETTDDLGLEGIKTKALQEIVPLIDKIDLPPLEKFKTLMMTIQAGDNKSLIPSAYAAAEKIENESERAQALLDVINEINYFSQKKK